MSAKRGEVRLSKLLSSMNLDLIHKTGRTPSKEFARTRLIERMRKRACFVNPALDVKAIEKFVSINRIVSEYELQLQCSIRDHAADFIRYVLERYMKRLDPDSLQECFSWPYILSNWSFGPGASNGVKGTGTVEKIDQPMTSTEVAAPFVKLIRDSYAYFHVLDDVYGSDGVHLVNGSRLTTVPKNEDSVRTIAIEPSGNMALQLAAGSFIEGALRYIGLDIRDQQEKNKRLARIGSIDCSLCTLDLSSASDMFSPKLVEAIWPREWYNFFMKCRSPVTELPNGDTIELKMISTMGNGFTFPMMTLSIVALVYANRAVLHNGPHRYVDWSHTAVFGDDIIVPATEYDSLCSTLCDAGLVVNHDKSYCTGGFRESCGGDYYEGYDVTPFYVKSLDSYANIYVVLNQVLRWCATHDFIMSNTLSYLVELVGGRPYLVPEWSDDFAGIRTSQCPSRYKRLKLKQLKRPYNGRFTLPLACAGYVESSGDSVLYNPRANWVSYKTGISKLPKSYLDGWDPRYGTYEFSSKISLMVSLVT